MTTAEHGKMLKVNGGGYDRAQKNWPRPHFIQTAPIFARQFFAVERAVLSQAEHDLKLFILKDLCDES